MSECSATFLLTLIVTIVLFRSLYNKLYFKLVNCVVMLDWGFMFANTIFYY